MKGGARTAREPRPLRYKLLLTYLLATLITFGVGLYNYLSTRMLLEDMTRFVESTQQLSEVQSALSVFQDSVDDYLFSRSSESLTRYYDNFNALWDVLRPLEARIAYTASGVRYKNLHGVIRYYMDEADQVIIAKRNEKTQEYVERYDSLSRNFLRIYWSIQSTLAAELRENAQQYYQMQAAVDTRTTASNLLLGASLVFVAVMVVMQSNDVTRPITRLAGYAQRVAAWEYGVSIQSEHSSLELSRLYDAFSIMVRNTQLYLEGLKDKQDLEAELAKEHIKGLETDNLLQQSQLQALHAQMNPHFIFNTINIGAGIARIQGDETVCEYLESAAEVFRYNLEGLSEATLAEELDNVEAYMNLLLTRFGHKLRFECAVQDDLDAGRFTLPRMTLQPLVENAFVHGVSPCEEGGEISVSVRCEKGCAVVSIANTGRRFPAEKLEPLYEWVEEDGGHLSGIGLRNVIKRLQAEFRQERPVVITSGQGQTVVTLCVPPQDSAQEEEYE